MRRNSCPVMLTGLLLSGKLVNGSGRSAGISLSSQSVQCSCCGAGMAQTQATEELPRHERIKGRIHYLLPAQCSLLPVGHGHLRSTSKLTRRSSQKYPTTWVQDNLDHSHPCGLATSEQTMKARRCRDHVHALHRCAT